MLLNVPFNICRAYGALLKNVRHANTSSEIVEKISILSNPRLTISAQYSTFHISGI